MGTINLGDLAWSDLLNQDVSVRQKRDAKPIHSLWVKLDHSHHRHQVIMAQELTNSVDTRRRRKTGSHNVDVADNNRLSQTKDALTSPKQQLCQNSQENALTRLFAVVTSQVEVTCSQCPICCPQQQKHFVLLLLCIHNCTMQPCSFHSKSKLETKQFFVFCYCCCFWSCI